MPNCQEDVNASDGTIRNQVKLRDEGLVQVATAENMVRDMRSNEKNKEHRIYGPWMVLTRNKCVHKGKGPAQWNLNKNMDGINRFAILEEEFGDGDFVTKFRACLLSKTVFYFLFLLFIFVLKN